MKQLKAFDRFLLGVLVCVIGFSLYKISDNLWQNGFISAIGIVILASGGVMIVIAVIQGIKKAPKEETE